MEKRYDSQDDADDLGIKKTMSNFADNIYTEVTKKELKLLFLVGGIIGAIIFLCCYSWKVLDVTYDEWLLTGQDISQHYIGWKFYRATDWHLPLGQIDGMLYPDRTNIIFTDSIPVFALLFKFLSPILPKTFQYFGIWGLMSYFLVGALGSIIIRKSTNNKYLCWIGGAILSFSPYMFQRMYSHTALAGHWIILLALAIWVYRPYFSTLWKKTLSWGGLLILASLVHIYFIPMIMIFLFGFCLQDLFEKSSWKEDFVFVPIITVIDIAVLYGVGAFSTSGSFEAEGLGVHSANINSLFNSDYCSPFVEALPRFGGQNEGFGYLGLGILLLSISMLVFVMIRNRYLTYKRTETKKIGTNWPFVTSNLIVAAIIFVLAWSPIITYGTTVAIEIKYPEIIIKVLSIFRASGRFIWCVGYMIMIYSIMTLCKNLKRTSIAIATLAVILFIQAADMQPLINSRQDLVNQTSQFTLLESEKWKELAEDKETIIMIPHDFIKQDYGVCAAYEVANFAIDQEMSINYFPAARVNEEEMFYNDNEFAHELLNDLGGKNNLYILDSESRAEEYGLKAYNIDGYIVGVCE